METVTTVQVSANAPLASLGSSVWSRVLAVPMGGGVWGNVDVGTVGTVSTCQGSAGVLVGGWGRIVPNLVHLESLARTVFIIVTAIMVRLPSMIGTGVM